MINSDNMKPWYPYYVQQMLGNNLNVGDSIIASTSSSDDVRSLAWIHNGETKVFLICKANQPKSIHFEGLEGELDITKIDNIVSWEDPRVQKGQIHSNSYFTLDGYTVALIQKSSARSQILYMPILSLIIMGTMSLLIIITFCFLHMRKKLDQNVKSAGVRETGLLRTLFWQCYFW